MHHVFLSQCNCKIIFKATEYPYLKLPYSAGMKQPHIAITVSRPICLRYVLLPLSKGVKMSYQKSVSFCITRHADISSNAKSQKIKHFIYLLGSLDNLKEWRITTIQIVRNKCSCRSNCLKDRMSHSFDTQCPSEGLTKGCSFTVCIVMIDIP